MKLEGEDVPLGRLLYCTAQSLFNTGERILKASDVTFEQMHLLKELVDNDGVKQKELGDMISKTPANTTRIIDRLELKGLLARHRCAVDRRAIKIYITPAGHSVCRQGENLLEGFVKEIYAGVTEEEMVASRSFFNKVRANISRLNFEKEEK